MRRKSIYLALILITARGFAVAAPLALLDRNGSHVSIEAYAPNIVRVTLSVDKDLALAPPGFGIIAPADATGWKHRTLPSGDEFSSGLMSVEVNAPAGETVCVPFLVTNKGYGIVWDNPSDTVISAGVHGHTTWKSNVGERVSYFVITGATL